MEDSVTSGRIHVVCPESVAGLLSREAAAFMAIYPQSRIDVSGATSAKAIRELFGARADVAVLTRELASDERAAAVRGRLEVEGYRVAGDAIVMVVPPTQAVENLSLEDVRRIYSGEATSWRRFGGPDLAVVPVAQPGNEDLTEDFSQRVLGGEPIRAHSLAAGSDSEVVAEVLGHPGAIGYVTLGWAERGARTQRISSLTGLPYWKPDLEAVYRNEYPMSRYVYLYIRTVAHPLANGFLTFVTSQDGQRIVREAGLVPTAVPVRFVRRSPMQDSH